MLGHKRPLPPPSSYQTVLERSQCITTWALLDAAGDIYVEGSGKRPKLSDMSIKNSLTDPTSDNIDLFKDMCAIPSVKNEESDMLSHACHTPTKAKKPLFASDTARKAARACYENDHGSQPDQFGSPKSQHLLSGGGEWNENVSIPPESQDVEAQMLVRLTSAKDQIPQPTDPDQDESDNELEESKRLEEARGRDRSRLMRERTLAANTRSFLQCPDQNATLEPGTNERSRSSTSSDTIHCQTSMLFQAVRPRDENAGNFSDTTPEHTSYLESSALTESSLNICQAHIQGKSLGQVQSENSTGVQKINPYSREEAGRYRDENRRTIINDRMVHDDDSREEKAARLLELTERHQQKQSSRPVARILDTGPILKYIGKPYNGDHQSRDPIENPISLPIPTSGQSFNSPQQSSFKNSESQNSDQEYTNKREPSTAPTKITNEISSSKVLTPFQMLELQDREKEESSLNQRITVKSPRTQQEHPTPPWSGFIAYSNSDEFKALLNLPPNFDEMDTELQEAIVAHEALKERKRDLDVIYTASKPLAQLGATMAYSRKEHEWKGQVQEFSRKIIDEKLNGKRVRDKIKHIGDFVRKKMFKYAAPDRQDVELLVNNILQNRLGPLQEELSNISEEICTAKLLRDKLSARRHKIGKAAIRRELNTQVSSGLPDESKKHVSRSGLPVGLKKHVSRSGTARHIPARSTPSLRTSNHSQRDTIALTERKRQAQYSAQDKKYSMLIERRKLFSDATTQDHGAVDEETSALTPVGSSDGEVSEDDEGIEYYAGAGVKESQISVQRPDQSIVENMQSRERQRLINDEQQAQRPDMTLASENATSFGMTQKLYSSLEAEKVNIDAGQFERDFDDLCDDGIMVDPLGRFCYRYLVSVTRRGFVGAEDNAEYEVNAFLDAQQANEKADDILGSICHQYRNSADYRNDRTIQMSGSEGSEGLRDWNIEMGKDGRASCRIRVIKEQYNPSSEAYAHAKIHGACIAKPIYWVLWRKTLSAIVTKDIVEQQAPQDRKALVDSLSLQDTNFPATDIALEGSMQQHAAIADPDQSPAVDQSNQDMAFDSMEDLFGPEITSPILQQSGIALNVGMVDPMTSMQDPTTSQWNPPAIVLQPITTSLPTPPPTTSTSPMTITNLACPTKPSDVPGATVQEIHFEQIQQFTSIALANRYAKDLFMEWYSSHLSAPSEAVLLRNQESHMEDELASQGDTMTWEQEASLEVEVLNGLIAMESFRVWVDTKTVKGPAN